MRKIPALIAFDHTTHRPTAAFNPKAVELLTNTPGLTATRKRDGQAMRFVGDDPLDIENWQTRHQVKPGKNAPEGFELAESDETTGKKFGWVPAATSPVRKQTAQALQNTPEGFNPPAGATFELCGPKVQNKENLTEHHLFQHGAELVNMPELSELSDVAAVHAMLTELATQWKTDGMEGVVIWADGAPLVKVRVKDFAL